MKAFRYIALAALTISFAACEQEGFTPSVQGDGDAVKITASIGALQTRVNYDAEGRASFSVPSLLMQVILQRMVLRQ